MCKGINAFWIVHCEVFDRLYVFLLVTLLIVIDHFEYCTTGDPVKDNMHRQLIINLLSTIRVDIIITGVIMTDEIDDVTRCQIPKTSIPLVNIHEVDWSKDLLEILER